MRLCLLIALLALAACGRAGDPEPPRGGAALSEPAAASTTYGIRPVDGAPGNDDFFLDPLI